MSKRIPVIEPDGQVSAYISKYDAWDRVADGKASWNDPIKRERIYAIPRELQPKPIFPWEVTQSGDAGPLVWQLIT